MTGPSSLRPTEHRVAPILLSLHFMLAACACSATGSTDVCEPGRVATCPCADGGEGVQTCDADGAQWGVCDCPGAATPDAGAGVSMDSSASDASLDAGPGGGSGHVDSAGETDAASGGTPADADGSEDAGEPAEPEDDGWQPRVDPPEEDTWEPPATGDSVLTATITSPATALVIEEGDTLSLIGVVTDSVHDSDELTAMWLSDQLGTLWEGTPAPGGWVQIDQVFSLPMQHQITLRVENPDGDFVETTREVGVCTYGGVETFDAPLVSSTWKTYGDAYWDSGADGGWLEMTGNLQSKQGAIFNIAEPINPGNVEIHFSIWTGQGQNTGADGFAMSVINTDDVATLETIINTASNGGCLGYGVSGNCGPMTITAFHIEFDTWHNAGDPINDPTTDNHVAITLNGDPGNHFLWASAPSLEDSQWHDIKITTQGTYVTVELDGTVVIADHIPAFKFHGGYVGFSGTTGWASNYHRFDNLAVLQECLVP